MKTAAGRKILTASLALLLAFAACTGAAADGGLCINGSLQPGGLDGLYVTGSGGLGQLTGERAYVLTGDGLTQLGGGDATVPEGDPEHLSVTDTISLDYDKVRVALYYYAAESSIRNPTLEYANLENEIGSGYDFGYYDSSRQFHALGGTDETRITMVMDRTVPLPGARWAATISGSGGHTTALKRQLQQPVPMRAVSRLTMTVSSMPWLGSMSPHPKRRAL